MFQVRYPTSGYSRTKFSAGIVVTHILKTRCSNIILESNMLDSKRRAQFYLC